MFVELMNSHKTKKYFKPPTGQIAGDGLQASTRATLVMLRTDASIMVFIKSRK